MDQDRFAHGAPAPEAATDEPASPVNHQAAAPPAVEEIPAFPDFASAAEEQAYRRGVSHGIRCAGREPGHPHMPHNFDLDLTRAGIEPTLVSGKLLEAWPPLPHDCAAAGAGSDGSVAAARVRQLRHDGWTPDKERRFIETLADSGVVADACRASGMSRDAAYTRRRSAGGRAFALAWEGALLIARGRLADEAMSRVLHGIVDRVYRNGELVAERHRYDNRLTMAVLSRLDRHADGLGENAPVVRAVAQEFDRFLDVMANGAQGAEHFLALRFPVGGATRPAAAAGPCAGSPAEELSRLARLSTYGRHGVGLAAELDASGLDPEAMESWTDLDWERAELSGFLARLPAASWPEAARAPGPDETNGMCKLRKLYLRHHGEPDPAEPERDDAEEDDFEGLSVWESDEGEWFTDFPPPPEFDGFEEGDPLLGNYRRELTEEERLAIGCDEESLEAEREAELAARHAARERFFGFAASPAQARPEAEGEGGARSEAEPATTVPDAAAGAEPEPSGPRVRSL